MKSNLLSLFVLLHILFTASVFGQKYQNGTRLLKGAEVLSATPLQLDYVLEKLADTAKITVNLHEGKTHLVLDDGSGKWREWWYYMGKWQVKTGVGDGYTLPPATRGTLGGIKIGCGLTADADGTTTLIQNNLLPVLTPMYYGTEESLGVGGRYGTIAGIFTFYEHCRALWQDKVYRFKVYHFAWSDNAINWYTKEETVLILKGKLIRTDVTEKSDVTPDKYPNVRNITVEINPYIPDVFALKGEASGKQTLDTTWHYRVSAVSLDPIIQ